MQYHRYDVVIVGAGGAGMRAAIESTKRARTAVLTKLYPTRSHTGAAQGGMCTGPVAYALATGEIHIFHAKAVVFATGGAGKVFKTTSNAHTLTGDGMGVVFRKGLPLEDMEFYQFHPTGLAGLGILLTEGARG